MRVRSPGIQVLDHVGFRAKVLLEQDQFEPQSLSMTLHSLALLEYRNHLLLRAAATVAARRMDDLTPQVRGARNPWQHPPFLALSPWAMRGGPGALGCDDVQT